MCEFKGFCLRAATAVGGVGGVCGMRRRSASHVASVPSSLQWMDGTRSVSLYTNPYIRAYIVFDRYMCLYISTSQNKAAAGHGAVVHHV